MSPRFALLVVLFVGCDESDDREAHPIVLVPAAEKPKSTGTGEEVSPLTPIVLPTEATPPPMKAAPPPPPSPEPVEPKIADAGQAEVAAAPQAIPEAKPVSPPQPQKPPAKKTKKKKR